MKDRKVLIGVLCAVACEFIYGMSYMFTKTGTENASALTLLGWRFLLAFIVMTALVLTGVMKVNLKGKKLKALGVIMLLDPALYYICETVGISHTSASESGTFLACIPVVSLIASTIYLKKKPKKFQVIGICITLTGVLITVLGVGIEASFSFLGYLMLFGAVTCYSLYSVVVEGAEEFTGAEITYAMIISGCVVYTTAAVIEALVQGDLSTLVSMPFTNPGFLEAIIYQGIGCSIMAFFMSNVAIANIGVNKVSCFFGLSVVVSILSGVIFLNESFGMVQIIGAAVIIGGVYFANMDR